MLKKLTKYFFFKVRSIFQKSAWYFYRGVIPEQNAIYFTVL